MRRTTLAVVLATGALSVPAVALAAGSGDSATGQGQAPATTPVQQEPERQAPNRDDCPERDGSGGSGGGSDSQTAL